MVQEMRLAGQDVFENLIETLFMNDNWELMIYFLMFMNDTSCIHTVITIHALQMRLHHSISSMLLNIIDYMENLIKYHLFTKISLYLVCLYTKKLKQNITL
jgi:hypothetical protein